MESTRVQAAPEPLVGGKGQRQVQLPLRKAFSIALQNIRVRFWRHAADSIPASEADRAEWLYERWQELDDWVGEQRGVTPQEPALI